VKPSRSVPIIILGIGAGLWLLFAFVPTLIVSIIGEKDWTKLGQIGDQFGAANALFSSLAMLAAIYAVIQGQHMLRLQQKEFELTREEMKRSADAQGSLVQQQARLVDSQLMLAIMSQLTDGATGTVIRNLAREPQSRIEAALRVMRGQAGEVDHSIAHEEFVKHVRDCTASIRITFDRLRRLYDRALVDEFTLRMAMDEDTKRALTTIVVPVIEVDKDYSLRNIAMILNSE